MGGSQRQLSLVLKLQDQASKELRRIAGEVGVAERASRNWGSTLQSVGKQLLYVGTAAAGFLGYGVKIAADLETAQVGLETLLGSAEEADATIKRLKVEAARTPFELPGLTQATQLLTSVTKDGDRSIDILLDVGEALAAMGKGQAELDRIIVNLQQIAATGRAATIDIRQFAFAGIPIYEMLTETTGKSGEALEELITSGGVTFDLLTNMFDEANDAGGRFFNAFQNQSGTFNQAWSNMKDSMGIFLADLSVSTGIFDALTESMMTIAGVLGDYRTHLDNIRESTASFLNDLDRQTGLVTLVREAWDNIVFMYRERLQPALAELWEQLKPLQPFLEALAKVFGTMLLVAIGLVVIIIGGLAAVLIELLTWAVKLETFIVGKFVAAWDAVVDALVPVIEWVDKLIEKFERAIQLASSIGGSIGDVVSGAASKVGQAIGVNDAIISPDGDIITTHPDDYLIATKNPHSLGGGGGPIHIHLSLDGREISEVVFDRLMGDLKTNLRLT